MQWNNPKGAATWPRPRSLSPPESNNMELAEKRYLVTGGSGFLGSHLVRGLLGVGAIVRSLHTGSRGRLGGLEDVEERVEYLDRGRPGPRGVGSSRRGCGRRVPPGRHQRDRQLLQSATSGAGGRRTRDPERPRYLPQARGPEPPAGVEPRSLSDPRQGAYRRDRGPDHPRPAESPVQLRRREDGRGAHGHPHGERLHPTRPHRPAAQRLRAGDGARTRRLAAPGARPQDRPPYAVDPADPTADPGLRDRDTLVRLCR